MIIICREEREGEREKEREGERRERGGRVRETD